MAVLPAGVSGLNVMHAVEVEFRQEHETVPTLPPQGNGKTCDGPLKETRPCNEQPCSDGNKNIHCII